MIDPVTVFVNKVKKVVTERVGSLAAEIGLTNISPLLQGKMLRTKLAARLLTTISNPIQQQMAILACAAIELVHTSSLCHDDVIDKGFIRRNKPTLWRITSTHNAVLIGDLLFCNALNLMLGMEKRYQNNFIAKVKEMCIAELRHEESRKGPALTQETCLDLARKKTGSLFAFVGYISGAEDEDLAKTLEEVGYKIGTAYQLADDLLDIKGEEEQIGKTLGTDYARGKLTLPQIAIDNLTMVEDYIQKLCCMALAEVVNLPKVHKALTEYLVYDLNPVLENYPLGLNLYLEFAK